MTADTTSNNEPQKNEFIPIVGIGASAGGLEAFEKLFTRMPVDSGMAFIIVQHLDPTHDSILADLITRYTEMPVAQVEDGVKVQPNHIYIIPPNSDLALMNGELHLMRPSAPRGFRLPIDFFFRSLADDLDYRAICIVLSGTGSDGSLGVRAIKEVGGMAISQDPNTAKYSGMPQSAIATGVVDMVLPVENIPDALIHYVQESLVPNTNGEKKIIATRSQDLLRKVFILLRDQTGHDFSLYKPNTISRRIERRMTVNQIRDLEKYIQYLQTNPLEVETLFKELLIGVTGFFRDEEGFAALIQNVLKPIVENREQDDSIRVWVAGCSTGEEAYSIAMLLHDIMDETGEHFAVQIFATDIDNNAIEQARMDIYPDNIAADVPPRLLKRYFKHENNQYQVIKQIRSSVVFAEQSIIKDPPFSRLDLISCRNLLIYLGAELQREIMPMFHYALRPDGFLFLGTSETLAGFAHLFDPLDKRWKIFKKIPTDQLPATNFNFSRLARSEQSNGKAVDRNINFRDVIETNLLSQYAHPATIIDDQGNIHYFYGDTGKFLQPSTGEASLNILRMARQGIRIALTNALRSVFLQKDILTYDNLRVELSTEEIFCNLVFIPIDRLIGSMRTCIVIFEEIRIQPLGDKEIDETTIIDENDQRMLELEQELQSTREYLQTTIEELETSNEELKSTNEELQSSNEELQSTNEELETAKEELQSVNEELITVNSELSNKMDELAERNDDQNNMLNSMQVGIIFLDLQLQVRLFNPIASDLLNLIELDVGRPLRHFASNFNYENLTEDLEYVLDTLNEVSKEIRSQQGYWYAMSIRPYRTVDGDVDGLIISFSDITFQKNTEMRLTDSNELYHQLMINLPQRAVLVYDRNFIYVFADGAIFEEGFDGNTIIGKSLHDLFSDDNIEEILSYYQNGLDGKQIDFKRRYFGRLYECSTSAIRDSDDSVIYGIIFINREADEDKQLSN